MITSVSEGKEAASQDDHSLDCGGPATVISAIQGEGDASPLVGRTITVQAVVTGVFSGLDGFFVEEEADDRDAKPATSEGLFIYAPNLSVQSGQRLRLTGRVAEFHGLTELTSLADLKDCGEAPLPETASIRLPWTDDQAAEFFEGMRVHIPQTLIINDLHELGRYGSLTLGSRRHFVATSRVAPGDPARQFENAQKRDTLVLDDGRKVRDPRPIPYPADGLTNDQPLRSGDGVANLTGILDFRYGQYRLQPTREPTFISLNPRPSVPDLKHNGPLRVASLNTLNYFNGDGQGGGFPTARGADSPDELQRQKAKLVSAIRAMDADIVGLMELENDGYGLSSAIADLTAALGEPWRFINPGMGRLGDDRIAVGLVYRRDRVRPLGEAATLSSGAFAELNRPPLAQTFGVIDHPGRVTVVVNHFKSKNCGKASGLQGDQGDGQGCWNPVRKAATRDQLRWLAEDPTGLKEPNVLIIGDLNAYAMEDPVKAFEAAGYVNLIRRFEGESAYSFVYRGKAGSLDYALASPALARHVSDATDWHINADESSLLDYNLEGKQGRIGGALFAPGPYRSSDHDPLLIELGLKN